jgi:solute carrier family 10 (sodium/bile acid cotransporter), member 7
MILLPTMLFHQMQLMVCAVLARRWASQAPAAAGAEAPPQAVTPPVGAAAPAR